MNHENKHTRGELLQKIDAHWNAADHPLVGQIYLYDNPLLTLADVNWNWSNPT